MTDEDLMEAVASGDETAFEELCRRHQGALARFLFRQTGGRDVEDLHQETWIRIVRSARRFDRTRRFSPWLYRIAANVARDWHRRRSAEPLPIDPATLPAGIPVDRIDDALDARRLLEALPEPQRTAILLRYDQGFTEEEIATILGCPKGTVKSRIHYAIRRMIELARGGSSS